MLNKTILMVGTYDTKNDELDFMAQCISQLGGRTITMDVSVLGDPVNPTDISKHQVAKAAGSSIESIVDGADENHAMQVMALGASRLALQAYQSGEFHGVVILGGTMGTDLALDVCQVLPIGVPKYVVSTVSFSPLIPAERLSADIQMILWAGGLYGLNSICKSSLSQAAGAVLGAAAAVTPPSNNKPVVGMTSLGSSCLTYMKALKPALEERGFEVAIFHATGMGGMAFESIARQGGFACVMDFALPELGNLLAGSVAHGGQDRMLNAGAAAIPQLVAPGSIDLIDFAGWQELPETYQDRPFHAHNRLIKSSTLNLQERRATAREMVARLATAQAPVHVILPNQGLEEWDREGGPAHDPDGLQTFNEELRKVMPDTMGFSDLDAHINDMAFVHHVLELVDAWIADGTISQ